MTSARLPTLWVCGPPGVGKTTVGWELFSQLTRAGVRAGYVDIDQLGICYPEPASDPGRHRLKVRHLDPIAANFQAAGAECLIVSGVVDPEHGVHVDQLAHAALMMCRLRLDRDELRRRLLGRGAPAQQVATALAEADAMDRGDATGMCVDTTRLTVAEVTRLVRDRTKGWRNADAARTQPRQWLSDTETYTTTIIEGPVLRLCGPTGVGKSRVGWEVYQRIRRAGDPAAFIDLDQLGFLRPAASDDPRHHRLKARNLAALWRTYRTAGAQFLVVVGPAETALTLASTSKRCRQPPSRCAGCTPRATNLQIGSCCAGKARAGRPRATR